MPRKTVIFISGKMSGLPDYGRAKFADVEARLKARGYIVLNPAVLPVGMEDKKYMPICIAMIDAADAIYMLEGWERSKGARAEIAYAERQGKDIMYGQYEISE